MCHRLPLSLSLPCLAANSAASPTLPAGFCPVDTAVPLSPEAGYDSDSAGPNPFFPPPGAVVPGPCG
jgi:hypothetical protein